MNTEVSNIYSCRSCHSADLERVLNFGAPYLSDFPASREEGEKNGKKVPLEILICRSCWLVQLAHSTPPDWMYRHFHYRSGITQTMRRALADIALKAEKAAALKPGDAVCDIGANDGTLLRSYQVPALVRVGFEPALNLQEEGSAGGNIIVPEYFTSDPRWKGQFKVISAIAMFYDLEDPNQFLSDVRDMMHPDGVFVLQMNYLPTMLQDCSFDNVSHEHLCYYSLTSLLPMLSKNGLFVYHVGLNDVNGGSVRVWCRKVRPRRPDESLEPLLSLEKQAALDTLTPYTGFAERITFTKNTVIDSLSRFAFHHRYLCGASTRGNTLLQFFGMDDSFIAGAGERDERKHGHVTAGSWIPIVSEEEARVKAKIMLVLPWHFANEIAEREADFLNRGGELLFPLPTPHSMGYTKCLEAT